MPVDFARYAQVAPVTGPIDYGASFRALTEQRLKQAQFNEKQRQFNSESEMRQKEHQDLVQHQNQQEHDINARFASEQGTNIAEKRHAEEMAKQAEHEKTLQSARNLIVHGKVNDAMALIGTLKEQGANVSVANGPDGMPVFNLQGKPDTVKPVNDDFNSIMGQVSGHSDAKNPYDTPLATVPAAFHSQGVDKSNPYQAEPAAQPTFSSPDATVGEIQDLKVGGVSPETQKQYGYSNSAVSDINALDQKVNGTSSSPVSNATQASNGTGAHADAHANPAPNPSDPNAYASNPFTLDTAQLQNWTNKRLDPVLSGLENAIPQRFRSEGHSYLQGLKGLGQTPEDTLSTMQKPLDTVAGLWKGEMAADAAAARAQMQQGGAESNRDLRVKGMGWQQMNQVSNNLKLGEHTQKYNAIDQVDRQLAENNPMADSQILHQIRSMFQSGVATQKDIDAVQYGIKPFLQRIVDMGEEQIGGTGLNPDSRAGLRKFLQSLKASHAAQLQEGAGQMESMLDTADSAEEAKSNLRYMNSVIPRDLWSEKQKKYNEMFSGDIQSKPPINHPMVQTRGGAKAMVKTKSGKPISASAGGAHAGVPMNPVDEAEEFLNEANAP